jgi:hypothetical protein
MVLKGANAEKRGRRGKLQSLWTEPGNFGMKSIDRAAGLVSEQYNYEMWLA